MKCTSCKVEMEKGAISIPGKVDTMWYSRKSVLKSIRGHDMVAWKCNKCGKVDLYSEDKK